MSTSKIIYEGPSLLDGQPIVCIAQKGSTNQKTGDMMQTYIIRSDIDPLSASKKGADYSVCGTCMHRGTPTTEKGPKQALNRTCYVTLFMGPLQKWKGYINGDYPKVSGDKEIQDFGCGEMVRIGTYGDGAAVPNNIWEALCKDAKGWTAYSHQRNPDKMRYMTSADTLRDAEAAWERGERTFRVISDVSHIVKGSEILCPASEEAGKRVTCIDCKLCAGASVKGKSIAIVAHGVNKMKLKASIESMEIPIT